MPPPSDREKQERLNALSHQVIGLCLEVHRELGPGLLESAYEEAIALELSNTGLAFERQKEVPLVYKGIKLNCGYRLNFIIEQELILELKSVAEILPIHHAQLLTYLKLERRSLGLLVNFNVPTLKQGINRVVAGDVFKEGRRPFSALLMIGFLVCSIVATWMNSKVSV